MKKIIFLVSFCLAGIWSYSQVTTDPKKQIEIDKGDNKVKTPRITPLCFGKVSADGVLLNGTSNVTVTKSPISGRYTIKCDGITAHSIVLINPNYKSWQCSFNTDNGKLYVTMNNGSYNDYAEFHFLIYEPG